MSENGGDKVEGFGLPDQPVAEKPIDPPDAAPDPDDLEAGVMPPQPEECAAIIRRSERGGVPRNYAIMNGGRVRRGGGIAGGMGRELQQEDKQNRIRNRILPKPSDNSEDAPLASSFVATGLGLSIERDSTEGGGGAGAEVLRGMKKPAEADSVELCEIFRRGKCTRRDCGFSHDLNILATRRVNNGIHKPQAVQVTHLKSGKVKVFPSTRHAGDGSIRQGRG
uniref:C3H1-type domain-containing protein n=1 Tax=Chromera velia CCMP2878 TaxID=1169474 RepID=A0A0G4G146_9ALVE|eukprot:Cvel_4041.t1-p1 / transcript=Cvel_4041.t1 / gene=Cvel_4041 / organism=Chromera_velia_CCMP2878 / gene_product=hypothetical protein / transcript_product=hypothetical protein / location=Cvel_scaffold172:7695-8716(-) / protein_length=222 / sequence_SO=supercontig / SO=protein_coding / is_pseudo=false